YVYGCLDVTRFQRHVEINGRVYGHGHAMLNRLESGVGHSQFVFTRRQVIERVLPEFIADCFQRSIAQLRAVECGDGSRQTLFAITRGSEDRSSNATTWLKIVGGADGLETGARK